VAKWPRREAQSDRFGGESLDHLIVFDESASCVAF